MTKIVYARAEMILRLKTARDARDLNERAHVAAALAFNRATEA